MPERLSHSWWVIALHGLLAVTFGVLALLMPAITLLWLVVLFAAFALLSGAAWIAAAIRSRHDNARWWVMLLLGIVSVAAGIVAVFKPDITALALVLVMGANALVGGILQVALGIRLRNAIEHEWLVILAGAVSILFGVLVIAFPAAGALAMVWIISVYAIASGVLMLAAGIRLRSGERRMTPALTH